MNPQLFSSWDGRTPSEEARTVTVDSAVPAARVSCLDSPRTGGIGNNLGFARRYEFEHARRTRARTQQGFSGGADYFCTSRSDPVVQRPGQSGRLRVPHVRLRELA